MAFVATTFKLDLTPGASRPVIYASQGDIGRPFKSELYWNGEAWTPGTGVTCKIRGKKSDATVFDYTATADGSTVTFSTTEQMTIISGPVECELVFSNDGDVIASANFVLMVEDSPYNPDAPSESVVPGIEDLIEQTIGGDVSDEVDAWLDAHPEVTTTVQDGSITEAKLADEAVTSAKVDTDFLKTISNAYVTPEQFGAVGDGTTDDTAAITSCMSYASINAKIVYLPNNYKITSKIDVPSNLIVIGNRSTITKPATVNYADTNAFFNCNNVQNVIIKGLHLQSANTETDELGQNSSNNNGFIIRNSENVIIENCKGNGLQYFVLIPNSLQEETKQVEINNCEIKDTHQPFYISGAENLNIKNIYAGQCDDTGNLCHHVYINGKNSNIIVRDYNITKAGAAPNSYLIQISDTNNTGYRGDNIYISNCRTITPVDSGFIVVSGAQSKKSIYIDNCTIINNQNTSYGGVKLKTIIYANHYSNVTINNSIFKNFTSECQYIRDTGTLTFNNCEILLYADTQTYDFDHCNGTINFNNCTITYNIYRGYPLDTTVEHIKPILNYTSCKMIYIRPGIWAYTYDGTTSITFLNCEFIKDGAAATQRLWTVTNGTGLAFIGCIIHKYTEFLSSSTGVTYNYNTTLDY